MSDNVETDGHGTFEDNIYGNARIISGKVFHQRKYMPNDLESNRLI